MRKNTILNQLLHLFPIYGFDKCVSHHSGGRYVKKFDCWQQFITLFYAQGKGLNSLRDITSSLGNYPSEWYHLGLKSVARSTIADANNNRSYEIFQDFFYCILEWCRKVSPNHNFRFKNPLYSMDASIISLCLSVFPWAKFRQRKGALKLHTLLDHRENIPAFITMTDGRCHDGNVVKDKKYGFPVLEPDSIIAVDRSYIVFKWLYSLNKQGITFVTRAKGNMNLSCTGQ